MDTAKLSGTLAAALLACLTAQGAFAQPTDAYALDSSGVIVKDPFGLCWRTSSWTAQKAVRECDPQLFPAEAAAPAPAPVEPPPVAVAPPPPPPPPAPVVVAPEPPAPVAVVADSDGDGVLDDADRCPGTPAGTRVDARGCEVIVLKGVNFATNSARLTPGSLATLDAAAETLRRNGARTEVAGYTDDRGSEASNRKLSQSRAEAVRRYLVSKGVEPARLTARGYGEDNPLAENSTESGRAANRRVELHTQ